MKKLLTALFIIAAIGFIACNSDKKTDKTDAKTGEKADDATKSTSTPTAASFVAKAHVCGADCKDGNHAYMHGDIGHTCTDACGTAHNCTSACTASSHTYAHGEAGHTCTDACAAM